MPDAALCYQILHLSPDATPAQVRQAYRELAKQWHPDKVVHDPELQQIAQEKLKEINAAYEFLNSSPSAPHPPRSPCSATRQPPQERAAGGRRGQTAEESRTRTQEAEALEAQARSIERLYLEAEEQRRRIRHSLCRQCGRPLTAMDKILQRTVHGRCSG